MFKQKQRGRSKHDAGNLCQPDNAQKVGAALMQYYAKYLQVRRSSYIHTHTLH